MQEEYLPRLLVMVHQRWSWFISAGGRLFSEAEVRVDDFWEVAGADRADIDNELDALHEAFPSHEVESCAWKNQGDTNYNALFFNRVHFANWCRYGQMMSEQADIAKCVLFILQGTLFVFRLHLYLDSTGEECDIDSTTTL
ncbi:uncharacterized protein LOC129928162 [Biomphalaria glabrata]|uniref:Uncharacterized protein LOC129928162 n=1 Tax=Biomphalaria glabrata TaxID=6526 RepID=A0A9W3BC50_BIOGL|nr:uncharacterized protein LOC129928162 [Biomphalaria glabrata]